MPGWRLLRARRLLPTPRERQPTEADTQQRERGWLRDHRATVADALPDMVASMAPPLNLKIVLKLFE